MSHPLQVLRRSLVAIAAAAVALAVLPAGALAAPPFGVTKLRQGSSAGAEDYVFTDGNVVFAQGTVDVGSHYRFTVLDAGGNVRSSSNCIQAFFKKGATFKYAIQPTDPVTTTTAWRFRVDEWNNATCSGGSAKSSSLYFDIARASAFADAGLTTPRATFAAGTSAYVKVSGIGRVKTSQTNTAQSDWQTTWVLPSGGTACANTAGSDRPDSDSGGLLPAGSFLKYRPNAGNPSEAWNLGSNYDGACPSFTPAVDGDWSLRLQKDGTHFVTLQAFNVDATPPETTLTSGPAGPTSFDSADLGFSADQPDATFECKLDGGAWQACSSPKHLSGLADASHTFQVRAIDPAGNVDATPASVTWTIDSTLPAVALTSPSDGTATSDTTPAFSGDAGTAAGDSSTITVKILRPVSGAPDELVQTLTTTRSGSSWSATPTTPLPEGSYKVHAEQADDAANVGFSAEHSFRVDTTAPAVAVLEPRIGSTTNDSTPQLWGTGGAAGGDDDQVTVKLWNGTTTTGAPAQTAGVSIDSNGSWTADASPALADGTYTVRAEQLDDAGNLGLSRAHTFHVDTTPPDTTVTAGPTGSTASTDASLRFTTDEPGATFECLIDDGDWGPCASPKAYVGLAGGSHTFMVRSIDAAGNEDPTPASRSWTVDTTLPEVTLVNPADGSATNDTTPDFDGSAGTLAGDSATVTVKVYRPVSGAPDELVETRSATRAGDGSWSVGASPALPEGDYVAHAEQLDEASNVGTTATHSFRVDTTAPTTYFTLTPPPASGSTSASFHFDSSEAGSTFECRLDGGAWTACSSPEVRSGLSTGAHSFQVRASDAAGNTDATPATAAWTVDPTLPALSLDQPSDGIRTNDPTPSFSGHAGTAAGDSATVTVKIYRPVPGAPDVLVQTRSTVRSSLDGSWSVTASPELDDGDYLAYAQQTGSSGTAVSAAHSFTVDTTPPHTQLSSGPQGTTSATTASFRFSSSEAGSSFECRLDGGAWTACSSPKGYSSLSSDVHTFDVRATDEAGNVDPAPASRTWIVDSTAVAVTLETPLDDSLTNDSTPLFSGHASTGAGASDTVTVEIYRPVAGGADELVQTRDIVRSSTDGSWSVAASPALADGNYIAYATQDDSNGDTAYSAPRSFTVDASPPSVTLTAPATGVPTNDVTPTLSGGAGAGAGDSPTVTVKLYAGSSASGSPIQTMPVTRAGASWSTEPAALTDGTYTALVEQADDAGNTGTSSLRTFRVDTTAPGTVLSGGPSGTTTSTLATFAFGSSEPGSRFECRRDGGAFAACSSPRSYSGLGLGSHAFAVRAIDPAGNVDATPATRSWTIARKAAPAQPAGPATPSPSLTFSLRARSRQRFRRRTRRLVVTARCSAACALRLSGRITLSRARRRGLTHRQAAARRLKLRAASYTLTKDTSTRVRLRISRRLARRILAGLRQRRRVTVRLTGVADHSGAASQTVRLRIRLRR